MTENNSHQNKRIPHKILTKQELQGTAKERVHLIAKEFTDGFKFLEQYPKSVTIFGGVHFTENDTYYIQARSLS